jgi:hypothetical protein
MMAAPSGYWGALNNSVDRYGQAKEGSRSMAHWDCPPHFRLIWGLALYMLLSGCEPNSAIESYRALNDTGIAACATETENMLPCNDTASGTDGYPGQDAEFGRDAIVQDDSDGRAGFSFVKIGADGKPLAFQDVAWDNLGSEEEGSKWSCVLDQVTKLVWSVKVDDETSLHHKDYTFSWYNTDPSSNGGSAGLPGGGECGGYLPVTGAYSGCDTYTFPRYVNENGGLCGHSDWRLPTREELHSLHDYGISSLYATTIDSRYFPHIGCFDAFSSANPARNFRIWVVRYCNTGMTTGVKETPYRVVLVRGGATIGTRGR